MQKTVLALFSLASLSVCLLSAVFYFLGRLSGKGFKLVFLAASVGWFVFATLWAKKRKRA